MSDGKHDNNNVSIGLDEASCRGEGGLARDKLRAEGVSLPGIDMTVQGSLHYTVVRGRVGRSVCLPTPPPFPCPRCEARFGPNGSLD